MGVRVYKGGSGGGSGSQGPAGPAGLPVIWFEDGEQGDQGVPGPTGVAGAAGASGAPGAQGVIGMPGPPGFDGSDPEEPLLMAGPMGPQGASGASGASGVAGAQGPIGLMGPPGFDGSDPDEPMLVMGPAGAAGTGGAAATAISGIAASNTTYTSGTVTFTGVGGGVTVSSNTGQRIDISVAAPAAAQTFVGGIAGSNTTYTSGTVSMSGFGGGITVSSNTGQRIDLSVAAPVAQTVQTQLIAGIQNSQTTYTSGTVNLVDLANITIRSTTGNKYEFSVAAPGGGAAATHSFWHNMTLDSTQSQTLANSMSYVQPVLMPYPVSASFMRIPVTMGTSSNATIAVSTANFTASLVSTHNIHVYTRGTGASSLSLQSVASGSGGFTQQWSVSENGTQYTITFRLSYPLTGGTSLFSTTFATSSANFNVGASSTRWWSGMTAHRFFDIPFDQSVPAGPVWFMHGVSSTVGTQQTAVMTNNRLSFSYMMHPMSAVVIGRLGEVTNNSIQLLPGVGSFSTAGGATTGSLPLSAISSSASHPILNFGLHRSSGA